MQQNKLFADHKFVLLRVAFVNSTSLSSFSAAVTTLIIVPLIEIALLVFASIGVTGRADLEVIYASVLVAFGTSVLLGVVNEITRDRNLEILQTVLAAKTFHFGYWVSKIMVPLLSALIVATVSLAAVFMLSGFAAFELFITALIVLPVACLTGSVVGVCASLFTLAGNDPYLVSNVLASLLALATGTILPLADYPLVFEVLGRLLPFSWLIEGYRSENLFAGTCMELVIATLWITAAATSVRWVMRRFWSGKIRYLLW